VMNYVVLVSQVGFFEMGWRIVTMTVNVIECMSYFTDQR